MIFLIALVSGAFVGITILAVFGFPVLFLRRWRLVWGDRRVWWSVIAALVVLSGFDFVAYANGHAPPADRLDAAFRHTMIAGWMVGVAGLWFGILLALRRWGKDWKKPFAGWSWVVSLFVLLVMIALAAPTSSEPELEAEDPSQPIETIQEHKSKARLAY